MRILKYTIDIVVSPLILDNVFWSPYERYYMLTTFKLREVIIDHL